MAGAPASAGDSAAYERRPLACDDVVVVSACRTALCKAKRGGFKDTPVDDLVAAVLKETIRRTGVEPEAVGDVCFGSVMGPSSQRANECRIAMFLAGFPASVPVHTVNRQCSSGALAEQAGGCGGGRQWALAGRSAGWWQAGAVARPPLLRKSRPLASPCLPTHALQACRPSPRWRPRSARASIPSASPAGCAGSSYRLTLVAAGALLLHAALAAHTPARPPASPPPPACRWRA